MQEDLRTLTHPHVVLSSYPMRHVRPAVTFWARAGETVIGGLERQWQRLWLKPEVFPKRVSHHGFWAHQQAEQSVGTFSVLSRELRSAKGRHAFDLLARCAALVSEMSERSLGLRPHDNQLMAAYVMLRGAIAELATGEGKTLAAAIAAACAAAAGRRVHVITANDYLAQRDAHEMGPLYRSLGLTVASVVETMDSQARRQAWGQQVVYASNKVVAFDHLRDRVAYPQGFPEINSRLDAWMESVNHRQDLPAQPHLQGLDFCIVDEADSVLIDDASTPLILSVQADAADDTRAAARGQILREIFLRAQSLVADRDFKRLEGTSASIRLLESGREAFSGAPVDALSSLHRLEREELAVHALTALHLLHRDEDYVVMDGSCQIIDPETGRTMPDRKWNRGLQQMVEIKEGVALSPERETIAQMSYQRLFQRYVSLSGMTGTAREVRSELGGVYGLLVLSVPAHRPVKRRFAPVLWSRHAEEKEKAVTSDALRLAGQGLPVMVACVSVAESERLAAALRDLGYEAVVLNARQSAQEAAIVAMAGQAGRITIATGMAGRGTDIRLSDDARAAGGLQVLIASPHSSSRVDRQFAGRCGRQGDPGTVWRYVSQQDNIFRDQGLSWLPLRLRLRVIRYRLARESRKARIMLMRYDVQLGQALAFSGGNR